MCTIAALGLLAFTWIWLPVVADTARWPRQVLQAHDPVATRIAVTAAPLPWRVAMPALRVTAGWVTRTIVVSPRVPSAGHGIPRAARRAARSTTIRRGRRRPTRPDHRLHGHVHSTDPRRASRAHRPRTGAPRPSSPALHRACHSCRRGQPPAPATPDRRVICHRTMG